MTRAILLGPLGPHPRLIEELDMLQVDGPVALITAGWEEAERNDAQVDRWLGAGTRNLGLFGRRLDILESDPDYADAAQHHRARLAEMQALYSLRIAYALEAVHAVRRRSVAARRSIGTELDEAIQDVRLLDETHATAIAAAQAEFDAAFPAEQRDVIAAHRAAVAALVSECAAVAIAGGHVALLAECLHMCDVRSALQGRPLLAWSSGCMAVAERLLVVDDHDPGSRPAEVLGDGAGVVTGIAPIPDARRRLRTDDPDRLALLARRCAPRACALLDTGDRIACDAAGQPDLRNARVIAPDGAIRSAAEAA